MRSIFLLFIIIGGCSSIEFKANNKLLDDWTNELQKNEPKNIPYIVSFNKSGKKLIYIAADHSSREESPTFKIIKDKIDKFKPDLVIIEGTENELGINPDQVTKIIKSIENGDRKRRFSEATYLALLASQEKIPFIGGEPTGFDIRKDVVDGGYFNILDLVSFTLLRGFLSWKRRQQEKKFNLTSEMNHSYSWMEKSYGLSKKEIVHEEQFLNWYKDKFNRPFKIKEINSMMLAPICRDDNNFTQKINCAIGKIRNSKITNVIAESLNKYKRVLIVYGGGHFVQQKKVLEQMLGQGNYLQWPF